jgi:hypothetical protein
MKNEDKRILQLVSLVILFILVTLLAFLNNLPFEALLFVFVILMLIADAIFMLWDQIDIERLDSKY